jgi:cyclophilin family peptidyl-prolyl cis-trans isomerase
MNLTLKTILILPLLLILISCNVPANNENTLIIIKTSQGDIKLKLYDGTPIHRDNFIKLINTGFYDGISFHRVIKDFMIQAGDPATKSPTPSNLPDSLKSYTIPAEFNPLYFHKKGSLAAAREGNETNPDMRSSGTQFYIVQGVKYNDDDLANAEQRINNNIKQSLFFKFIKQTKDSIISSGKTIPESQIQDIASIKMFQYLVNNKNYKISEDQRNVYKNLGGTPRLDVTYTVFGEVLEGFDVIDKIAAAATDINDRPINDVKIIKIKIVGN